MFKGFLAADEAICRDICATARRQRRINLMILNIIIFTVRAPGEIWRIIYTSRNLDIIVGYLQLSQQFFSIGIRTDSGDAFSNTSASAPPTLDQPSPVVVDVAVLVARRTAHHHGYWLCL